MKSEIFTTFLQHLSFSTPKLSFNEFVAKVIIYSYLDNPNFCENRIKIRVLNGGHDIPKEDIVRRFYRSKENFWNIYKKIVDEWNLFYNGTSEYIIVAQGTNSHLEIYAEGLYNEFIKDFK